MGACCVVSVASCGSPLPFRSIDVATETCSMHVYLYVHNTTLSLFFPSLFCPALCTSIVPPHLCSCSKPLPRTFCPAPLACLLPCSANTAAIGKDNIVCTVWTICIVCTLCTMYTCVLYYLVSSRFVSSSISMVSTHILSCFIGWRRRAACCVSLVPNACCQSI